jgi:hypothetical protein
VSKKIPRRKAGSKKRNGYPMLRANDDSDPLESPQQSIDTRTDSQSRAPRREITQQELQE